MTADVNSPPLLETFRQRAAVLIGGNHVLSEPGETERFSLDFWRQYRGRAACVLRPGCTEEVAALVRLSRDHGVKLVAQSGNTGLVAGSIPDDSGTQAVLSLSRLNRIRKVVPGGDYLVVEAGCILADIQTAARKVERLFPLSLGSEGSCQIGGNLATNAGGSNVIRYGMARELTLGVEVVLPSGQIWDGLRSVRKDNTGYDLKQIFIGSEGTLGIITAAALRLFPLPRELVTIWLAIADAADAVRLLERLRAEFGELISSFELLHGNGVELAVAHLEGVRRPVQAASEWHLLVEIAWSRREGLREIAESVLAGLFEEGRCIDGAIADSEAQRLHMWRIREGQSEAARQIGIIARSDVAVSIEDLPELLRSLASFVETLGDGLVFIPFGHVGDGNMHLNLVIPAVLYDELAPRFFDQLYAEVVRLNGSISAEHGVGRLKRQALSHIKPPAELELIRLLRGALDPDGSLNPGIGLG